nr:MAG TPA: Tle cognate immunity protein 4 N-terminal domain [Caudoviricetes sp.]
MTVCLGRKLLEIQSDSVIVGRSAGYVKCYGLFVKNVKM